jgi:hypothetical protein
LAVNSRLIRCDKAWKQKKPRCGKYPKIVRAAKLDQLQSTSQGSSAAAH